MTFSIPIWLFCIAAVLVAAGAVTVILSAFAWVAEKIDRKEKMTEMPTHWM